MDESKYSGDELEIIKLINLEMKYLYEEDTQGYISLMQPDGNLYPVDASTFRLPEMKIQHVELQKGPAIKEQKAIFEARVDLVEYRYDQAEINAMYVFRKGKQEGDPWKIFMID